MKEKYTHVEFISKLNDLGFNVEVHGNNDRDYTFSLFVNGISILNRDYPLFGYYCGGAYNTCGRDDKKEFTLEDIEIAIKKCSDVLMNEIVSISKVPTYFDCRDFLNENFGKTQVEKNAIKRVFSILKSNYQDLIKSVEGFKYYK